MATRRLVLAVIVGVVAIFGATAAAQGGPLKSYAMKLLFEDFQEANGPTENLGTRTPLQLRFARFAAEVAGVGPAYTEDTDLQVGHVLTKIDAYGHTLHICGYYPDGPICRNLSAYDEVTRWTFRRFCALSAETLRGCRNPRSR